MIRQFFKTDLTQFDGPRERAPESEANLVSSITASGRHAPALDIDAPCRLVESSTPGHFHLFIDVEMSWVQYADLLESLRDAGVIQEGFAKMSLARGASFLRKEGVQKLPGDSNSIGAAV